MKIDSLKFYFYSIIGFYGICVAVTYYLVDTQAVWAAMILALIPWMFLSPYWLVMVILVITLLEVWIPGFNILNDQDQP